MKYNTWQKQNVYSRVPNIWGTLKDYEIFPDSSILIRSPNIITAFDSVKANYRILSLHKAGIPCNCSYRINETKLHGYLFRSQIDNNFTLHIRTFTELIQDTNNRQCQLGIDVVQCNASVT